MEFCTTDRTGSGSGTGTGAHDSTSRGLYPAPDSDDSASTTAGADSTTTVAAAPRRLHRATPRPDADSAEVQAMTATPAPAPATSADTRAAGSILCVIEPNADIAEGLQHLLHTVPGVARVVAHGSTAELLHDVALSAYVRSSAMTASDADTPDVLAFAAASAPQPDIMLLDAGKACDSDARAWSQVRASMLEVQRALPGSALVLMSVYPERLPDAVRSLATASIRKDTTRQELADLITQVRSLRASTCTLADAAGA